MEFVLAALLIFYLVPFTLAAAREHPRVNWILAINLLLGWTGVGWLVALAWSRSRAAGRLSRHWPWLHPQPPSRAARRRLQVIRGGRDSEANLQQDDPRGARGRPQPPI
jgi:hypothetical protein